MTPTVTTDDIGAMSPFVLGRHYTADDFARFQTWAVAQFADEDPGLSDDRAVEAVAYLICHRIELKQGKTGIQQEKIKNYSYTRAVPFTTSWLVSYQALVKPRAKHPSTGVIRADRDTSRKFWMIDRAPTGMENDPAW